MLRPVPGLALKLLDSHRSSLETCVYCPKLCRSACPVSNAEANETVTPWGKMSLAYFAARGDVPFDKSHASSAWACTGCFACSDMCQHKNPVAPVLMDARASAFDAGVAPEAARGVSERFASRKAELSEQMDILATQTDTDRATALDTALLVGCGYARRTPEVARDAIFATHELLGQKGQKVRPARACCGLPLLHAGDREGFQKAAKAFSHEVSMAPGVVVVDPGCARTLLVDYPAFNIALPKVELFVDLAADAATRSRSRLRPLTSAEVGPVRFHDPCQLGRGLGRTAEPRAILERIAPSLSGFQRERASGECSGGGALLPITRPETSLAIARDRIAEHQLRGGGTLVTHCASSLHRFRTAGENAVDLVSLVAQALRPRAL